MISSRTKIEGEAVASHYDELHHFYRDVWGDHVHHGPWLRGDETRDKAVLQLATVVADRAGKARGVRMCDIGCGYGATTRLMANRGADVTGITIRRHNAQGANKVARIQKSFAVTGCETNSRRRHSILQSRSKAPSTCPISANSSRRPRVC